MTLLEDKAIGCLVGAGVGDALGGATEGWVPEQIQQRWGGHVTGIVGPYYDDWRGARPIAPYHKGDGHITDDTLMTQALVEVNAKRCDHLDAFTIAEDRVPLLIDKKRWVPELETEALLLQRIFLAEKWLVARLHYGHVDPREAGDIAAPHQSSYGREAAGVFAAAVAAAMTRGATAQDVVDSCLRLSHNGTRAAIQAVCDELRVHRDWPSALTALRASVAPYDTLGADYRGPHMDARRPSRTKSIEELPIALGLVLVAAGDYQQAVLGSVNYGRDALGARA